jgi:hypothetical protein
MKPSYDNIGAQAKIDISINSSEERDYSNDPTFIKRAQEAKEFFEQVGFPEDLLKIREAMYGK